MTGHGLGMDIVAKLLTLALPLTVTLALASSSQAQAQDRDGAGRLPAAALVEALAPADLDGLDAALDGLDGGDALAGGLGSSCYLYDNDCYSECDYDYCVCKEACTWWFFNSICLANCASERNSCYTSCAP